MLRAHATSATAPAIRSRTCSRRAARTGAAMQRQFHSARPVASQPAAHRARLPQAADRRATVCATPGSPTPPSSAATTPSARRRSSTHQPRRAGHPAKCACAGCTARCLEYATSPLRRPARRAAIDAAARERLQPTATCARTSWVERGRGAAVHPVRRDRARAERRPDRGARGILLAVQRYLKPGVQRYTRPRCRAPQATARLPTTGAVRRAGARARLHRRGRARRRPSCGRLRLSDVISVVMDVAGVRAVREIIVRANAGETGEHAAAEDKWEIPVQPGKRARSTPPPRGSCSTRARCRCRRTAATRACSALGGRRGARSSGPACRKTRRSRSGAFAIPRPTSRCSSTSPRSTASARPGCPPARAPARRARRRRSCSGFLLFFDQLMADSFAQLASAGGCSRRCRARPELLLPADGVVPGLPRPLSAAPTRTQAAAEAPGAPTIAARGPGASASAACCTPWPRARPRRWRGATASSTT